MPDVKRALIRDLSLLLARTTSGPSFHLFRAVQAVGGQHARARWTSE